MTAGQRFCLKVKEPLHHEKSQFQDIMVFETTNHGRCLVLDGVIQLTEWDEFSYQEMIAQIPLFAHPNPESVLIVGAGDGGVLREVCRHKGVKKIVMCEIDEDVVKVSKTFLNRSTATAFEDPRAKLVFADAAKYLDKEVATESVDVVIVDSSDPNEGPADSLFTDSFYKNLARVLKPGGIVCTQGECMWLHVELIRDVLQKAKAYFPTVDYAYTCTPTYPCGQIGFLLCSKSSDGALAA
jgi:spermidine synthase